jgi:hypothetical protein
VRGHVFQPNTRLSYSPWCFAGAMSAAEKTGSAAGLETQCVPNSPRGELATLGFSYYRRESAAVSDETARAIRAIAEAIVAVCAAYAAWAARRAAQKAALAAVVAEHTRDTVVQAIVANGSKPGSKPASKPGPQTLRGE